MHIQTKPTQHSDSVKKPYQAPELVVMGDAAEMTQFGPGTASDGTILVTATGS